jgi:hypothetical protein
MTTACPSRVTPSTVASLSLPASNTEYVSLVGVVERERIGNIFLDFVLNDSSGRVPVRYIYPPPFWRLPEFAGLYVRINGRVLQGEGTCYIQTESVALVQHADEVSCHLIAVAHARLRQ